jgi:hypothetical protein
MSRRRAAAANSGPTLSADRSNDSLVRKSAHGRNFSYFSHRVFVSFQPVDLHAYLAGLLELVADTAAPGSALNPLDQINAELIRWVLLHRSQLNVLSLNRLLEALRGPDDLLQLPTGGALTSDEGYRIDMTLQFAIELELGNPRFAAWTDKRPRLQQAMIDAAYYISRQWLEQDRASLDPEENAESRSPTLDLSKDGREAFRAYLLHRMNLHEDDLPTDDDELQQQRAQRDAMALTAQELDTLYSVAVGVARTVAFATDKQELKRRWDECIKQNRPGAMSVPTQALYDALWLGPSRSLLEPTGPGKDWLVFRWRYLPSGESAPPATLEDLVDDAEPALQLLEQTEARLREALGEKSLQDSSGEHLFSLLADHHRVLPTTPAWTRVAGARADIGQARAGVGNPIALRRDVVVLHEYAEMISSSAAGRVVRGALVLASFLRELSPVPDSLDVALRALSDGLRLADCPLAEAGQRVIGLWSALHVVKLPGADLLPAAPSDDSGWIGASALKGELDAAQASGRRLVEQAAALASLVGRAWSDTRERLRLMAKGGSIASASAAEIVCAVRGLGPGRILELALVPTTPHRWTQALMAAWRGWDEQSREASLQTELPRAPSWLAAYALERLGVRSVGPDVQAAFIEGFEGEASHSLRDEVAQAGLWRGHGRYARLAIVACPATGSLTDGWTDPPSGGLLMVATVAETRSLVDTKLRRLLKSLQEPLLLAWEPLTAIEQEEAALRDQLRNEVAAKGFTEVWLYWGTAIGQRRPQVIDPQAADDLWLAKSAS